MQIRLLEFTLQHVHFKRMWYVVYGCSYIFGCICVCVHTCVYRGLRLMWSAFDHPIPYILKQGLSPNPELAGVACLSSQLAPEIPVSASLALR